MLGEIMDGISAVAQVPGLAVDERAGRSLEIDAHQSAVNLDGLGRFRHGCLLALLHFHELVHMNLLAEVFNHARADLILFTGLAKNLPPMEASAAFMA